MEQAGNILPVRAETVSLMETRYFGLSSWPGNLKINQRKFPARCTQTTLHLVYVNALG